MAVRIADTLKQQNDLKTFPVAFSEDIWIDQNKGEGTADYKDLQTLYNEGSLGGSGLPEPESKNKLLLSTENTETSKLEWSQVDKAKAIEIPLYETKEAAEADIANLSDGQIIATKDEGNENAKPVDVVEKGNLHAVTSNAVAKYVDGKTLYNKVTKDLGTGWNYLQKFEGLKAGTYVITTTIDATVNDINAVIDGVFTQIGVAGNKNGTLVIDVANDGTKMQIAVYTNASTNNVTLRTVLMKVA